jgi:cell division protein FtsB
MEQHFLESLSKFSTEHLLILLAGYSIGKLATYAIHAKKAAHKARLVLLQAEVERLKNELNELKGDSIEKAD